MHYKTERAFSDAYKSGVRHRAYLLYGSEPYLVERWTKKLAGGDDTFNNQRLDGRAPDFGAIWDAVEAMPLFAGEKTVLVEGLEPARISAEDLETLASLLENIPETTTLVFNSRDPSFSSGAAAKKIIGVIGGPGATVELGARSESDLVRFCRSAAGKGGCELAPDTAKYLLRQCHSDMLLLENEISKLCAYSGEKEITKAAIDAVVTPKTEARVFDLQRLILSGEWKKSLELLGKLFALREDPISILGTLSMGFCDLYRARAAKDRGENPASFAGQFGYKSSWRAETAYKNAARINTSRARQAVSLLLRYDCAMKSTGVDNRIYLEQAVSELLLLCGEGRR